MDLHKKGWNPGQKQILEIFPVSKGDEPGLRHYLRDFCFDLIHFSRQTPFLSIEFKLSTMFLKCSHALVRSQSKLTLSRSECISSIQCIIVTVSYEATLLKSGAAFADFTVRICGKKLLDPMNCAWGETKVEA